MHCHVMDHIEDATACRPDLITAIHYAGTPNTLALDGTGDGVGMAMPPRRSRSTFVTTVLLGAHRRLDDFRRLADRARVEALAV